MKIRALDASRLSWPTNWVDLFGQEAPIFLEIGFGNAEFLIDLAHNHPDANIIGVEISLPSIKKAERKVGRLPTQNVALIHGDARVVLWGGLQQPIERVYINFPDPWHKAAHDHRKLINERFLQLVASRLVENGRLNIATDDPGYQEAIEEALASSPYFDPRTDSPYLLADPERLETKYEQKAVREGRQPRYYLWRRNGLAADPPYEPPQELDMPHAVFVGTATLDEIAARFSPQRFGGAIPVRLMQLFKALDQTGERDPMLLVETHVAEEPLPQRIALLLQARSSGELLVGLHDVGFPRPTTGVHVAVGRLSEWLLSLHLDLTLDRHNLAIPLGSGLPRSEESS